MRITAKGQVTIPQWVRDRLGLLPNCEVEFDIVGDSARVRKARSSRRRGDAIVERLRGSAGQSGMTTDEIMALTRGE
jgi:AbrB family looped-hinge helix DNA binding protein